MSLTLVHKGSPTAPMVLSYFAATSHVQPALPPDWSLLVDIDGHGMAAPRTLAEVERARAACGSTGPLVLVGWSAGCQAVRSLLTFGAEPSAVIALDGTAGSWPGPTEAQIAPWRNVCDRARRGDALVVITCTEQTYTEQLPGSKAFCSTLRMVSILAEQPQILDERLVGVTTDGPYLRFEVHASARIDGRAHLREVEEHGPRIFRELVVPNFAGGALEVSAPVSQAAPTQPSPPRLLRLGCTGDDVKALQVALNASGASPVLVVDGAFGPRTRAAVASAQRVAGLEVTGEADAALLAVLTQPRDTMSASGERLGLRALAVAQHELELHVHEIPDGSNAGGRVDLYTHSTPESWCADFESWCRKQALLPGERDVLGQHRAVSELWAAAVRAGLARPKDWTPQAGDLAIWKRNGQDPRHGGQGHVSAVKLPPDARGDFHTIDGNVKNRVAACTYNTASPDLAGWIERP